MDKIKTAFQDFSFLKVFHFVLLAIPIGMVVVAIIMAFKLKSLESTMGFVSMLFSVGWIYAIALSWRQALVCGVCIALFAGYITQKWHCIVAGLFCLGVQYIFLFWMLDDAKQSDETFAIMFLIPSFVAGTLCTYRLFYLKEKAADQDG